MWNMWVYVGTHWRFNSPWENLLQPSIKYVHARKQASSLIEKEKIKAATNFISTRSAFVVAKIPSVKSEFCLWLQSRLPHKHTLERNSIQLAWLVQHRSGVILSRGVYMFHHRVPLLVCKSFKLITSDWQSSKLSLLMTQQTASRPGLLTINRGNGDG